MSVQNTSTARRRAEVIASLVFGRPETLSTSAKWQRFRVVELVEEVLRDEEGQKATSRCAAERLEHLLEIERATCAFLFEALAGTTALLEARIALEREGRLCGYCTGSGFAGDCTCEGTARLVTSREELALRGRELAEEVRDG